MRSGHSSIDDSLFSMDYKIPYGRGIEEHLEESQEEISFIKVKLTQAYQKLQEEIRNGNGLEEENQHLRGRVEEAEQKYGYEKKQNSKLKETLEVILKNRRMMEEEREENKSHLEKKLAQKDVVIEQLERQVRVTTSKYHSLLVQSQQKQRHMQQAIDKLREQTVDRDMEGQRQIAFANKIHILQQQINKLTQEKYVEVNRLRHQLQLYQRSSTPIRQTRQEEGRGRERKREFANRSNLKVNYNTKVSEETESEFNKENVNSIQMQSLQESSISKWKPGKGRQKYQPEGQTIPAVLTEDQKLTQYQLARKKAQHELVALQKIKRPQPSDRDKMSRLQRQIYHLDSDIARLKRRIRNKY